MFVSFLEHVNRDKSLRAGVGGQVVGYILARWQSLSSWWGVEFVADRRLALVNILKKMFSLDSEVHINAVFSHSFWPLSSATAFSLPTCIQIILIHTHTQLSIDLKSSLLVVGFFG